MPTLTIDFNYRYPGIRLKGLSFKALKGTNIERDIYRCDTLQYCIDTYYNQQLNGDTCDIKKDFLISALKQIHSKIPFDKIKTVGHYEMTADELMEAVKSPTL